MPSLYMVDTGIYEDGYYFKTSSSWATARDATTAFSGSDSSTSYTYGAAAIATAGRGGSTLYGVYRCFFQFDVSSVVSMPRNAKLRIYGRSYGNGRVNCVKALDSVPFLDTGDFDSIDGWVTGSSDGSGGGSNNGNVTYYSPELPTWSTSGYNDFELNEVACADMYYNTSFAVCIMTRGDIYDVAPGVGTLNRNGMYFSEYTGTLRDPYIDYSESTQPLFFGTNF
jgi:hypothetical protein